MGHNWYANSGQQMPPQTNGAEAPKAELPKPNPIHGSLLPAGLLLWHQIKAGVTTDRLVKGILGEGCFAVIAGESGSGKTFAALDMAIHIAAGWPWLGRKVRQCGVLYIGAEGQGGLLKRVAAWRLEHGVDETQLMPFVLYPGTVDLVNGDAGAKTVLAYVDAINACFASLELPAVGLVVVDTLARTFGGGDENSAQDMGKFVSSCGKIQRAPDKDGKQPVAVVTVHHYGKNASAGMRGSSALKAAADTVIGIEGTSGETRTMTIEKSKDGESGTAFYFDLRQVELPERDEDDEPITSCVLVPSEAHAAGAQKRDRRVPASVRVFMDALQQASIDGGRPAPADNNIPPTAIVVDEKLVRRIAYDRSISAGGDKAKEKAFERAAKAAQADGRIGYLRGLFWIARPQ